MNGIKYKLYSDFKTENCDRTVIEQGLYLGQNCIFKAYSMGFKNTKKVLKTLKNEEVSS